MRIACRAATLVAAAIAAGPSPAQAAVHVSLGAATSRVLHQAGLGVRASLPSLFLGSLFLDAGLGNASRSLGLVPHSRPGASGYGGLGYSVGAGPITVWAAANAGHLGLSNGLKGGWFFEPSAGLDGDWPGAVNASLDAGYLAGVGEFWFAGWMTTPVSRGISAGPEVEMGTRAGATTATYAIRVADRLDGLGQVHVSLGAISSDNTDSAYIGGGFASTFP